MTNYKLMISDLDGTLVPYGSDELSDQTKTQVLALSKKDIIFTIATGRSWKQAKTVVSELKITAPVIIQTGALIVDPVSETVLHTQLIHPRIHRELQQIAEGTTADHLVLREDGIYYGNSVSSRSRDCLLRSGERCTVAEGTLDNAAAVKHLFIGSEAEMKRIVAEIRSQINPLPNLILWPPDSVAEDWFLEIFDSRASKGQALEWLTDKLGVDAEETVAFGDGHNDLDMLSWAGTGVAVATSPDSLKEAADYLIAGPEEDGVAEFIERWIMEDSGSNGRKCQII